MIAMRNGGMRARPATAIAIGASMAAVEMLPGPSDEIAQPSRKNDTGISPVLPRHIRSAWCASLSSVPLSCACVNRSVTPVSVRNSWIGKPADDVVQRHPAEVDADDPGEGERQHTHIQPREAADDDGGEKSRERKPGERHWRASYK